MYSQNKKYLALLRISIGRKGCKACLFVRNAIRETSWFMSAQLWYKFGATVVSTEAIMSSSNTTTSSSSSSMSLSGKGPLLRLAVCGEEMRLSREASKNSLSLASEVGGAGSCNLARNEV